MSRRTAIIIIIAVLLVGTALLYFLLGGKAPSGLPIFTGNPFGNPPEGDVTTPPGGETGAGGEGGASKDLPRFVRLSDVPVAGAISFIKNGSTYVRFVERATGHIVDVNPSTLEKTKIINTTEPRIYSAVFKQDALGYVSRTIPESGEGTSNTSITIIAPKATSTVFTTQESLLRGNLDALGVLPNGNLLYVVKDTGEVVTSAFTGDKPQTLFSMPFREWQIRTFSNSSALVFTKASESALGYAYFLNLTNGGLGKVAGPLSGLIGLPNVDGTNVLISYVLRGSHLVVKNSTDTVTRELQPATLADKCVWSKREKAILYCAVPENLPGVGMPDNWLNGTYSFTDRIWKFDINTDETRLVLEPKKDFEADIDAIELSLSPDEDYLIFMNKKDLSLWALKLRP